MLIDRVGDHRVKTDEAERAAAAEEQAADRDENDRGHR